MKFSSGGETIGWEDMYEFDSCNQVCRLKGTSGEDKPTRPNDSEMETKVGTEDCGNYTITYGYDQYGNPIAEVRAKENGSDNVAYAIENGINRALWDLKQGGYFNYNKLDSLIKDVASFMGSGGWGELAKVNKDFNNPCTAFYHVTIGAAIASEMGSLSEIGINWSETELSKKEFGSSGEKWTEKNLKILIGTAVSYENKDHNTQLGFYYSTDFQGRMSLGLVDVGNLILSTMKYESGYNPDDASINKDDNGNPISIDVGLMQINFKDKTENELRSDGWFNPFKNTMRGVGIMFEKVRDFSTWSFGGKNRGTPTQYEWMQANYAYQGAGLARDKVWADMQTLSRKKHWGSNIIWKWDPKKCYVIIDTKTWKIIYPTIRY